MCVLFYTPFSAWRNVIPEPSLWSSNPWVCYGSSAQPVIQCLQCASLELVACLPCWSLVCCWLPHVDIRLAINPCLMWSLRASPIYQPTFHLDFISAVKCAYYSTPLSMHEQIPFPNYPCDPQICDSVFLNVYLILAACSALSTLTNFQNCNFEILAACTLCWVAVCGVGVWLSKNFPVQRIQGMQGIQRIQRIQHATHATHSTHSTHTAVSTHSTLSTLSAHCIIN